MFIDWNGIGARGFSLGIDPSGREHAIVVVKRVLAFPEEDGGVCTWSAGDVELCTSDVFTGEPGLSATVREADFALRKPMCDVIMNGMAHSPEARPLTELRVGVAVGDWAKAIDIVGNRVWETGLVGVIGTDPEPFTAMPISYDYAFGGTDTSNPDEETPQAFDLNPFGRGWHRWRNRSFIEGLPLPNCETPGEPTESPRGDYLPAAFGPIPRGHPDRARFAGTYDEEWIGDTFPFLPDDFDDRYYQATGEDQWIAHPKGGEEIKLQHLVEDGPPLVTMTLPDLSLPCVFSRTKAEDHAAEMICDTLEIEPELRRITVTSRASIPLHRDIFELKEAIIGKRPRAFWRARALGKAFRPLGSLGKGDAP